MSAGYVLWGLRKSDTIISAFPQDERTMSKKALLIAALSFPFFFAIATPLAVLIATAFVIITGGELYGWGLGLPLGLIFAAGFAGLSAMVTYRWAQESDEQGGIAFLNDAKNRFRGGDEPPVSD